MKGGNLAVSALTVVGLAIALTAGPAAAQRAADGPEVDLYRAAQLEAQAERQMGSRSGWESAERLLREAASLRPVGDVLAVQDLLNAAKIVYYEGDKRRAIREYETVGQRALDEGNLLAAAHAFADAAWIANEKGQGTKALELSVRAQRLANSPLIDDSERERVLGRFTGAPSIGR